MVVHCHVMLPKEEAFRVDVDALRAVLHTHFGAACRDVRGTLSDRGALWTCDAVIAASVATIAVPLTSGGTTARRVFVDRRTMAPSSAKEAGKPARILVVGAGGIGCELLKNLVLHYGSDSRLDSTAPLRCDIDAVDLDTIDATNLNRQFLFSYDHVGQSKSAVAAQVVNSWGRQGVRVRGYEGNVKDSKFDDDFFQQFDIVINGLDNVAARKHVNRMCVKSQVPLVESGTMGYNGQVQPIIKGKVECYDCTPKATEQKTFAVCTIHARPTTIVHCIHYAKELYAKLYGDGAAAPGNPHQQKSEFDMMVGEGGTATLEVERLYTMLFIDKINEVLSLKTSGWTITPPEPLPPIVPSAEGTAMTTTDNDVLSVPQLGQLLRFSMAVLSRRANRVAFNKDDSDAVGFITAVANLRAACFHIKTESAQRVKTIAGNIVPAIASTNAIIAACAVDAAVAILRGEVPPYVTLRHVAQQRRRVVLRATAGKLRAKDEYLLHTIPVAQPNPKCLVCSAADRTFRLACNATLHTLGSFIDAFLIREMGLVAPTVDVSSSTLYEHDEFEELAGRPLAQWVSTASKGAETLFTIGDLNQSVEWTLQVSHNGALDETAFVSDWNAASIAPVGVAASAAPAAAAAAGAVGAADDDDDVVVAYHPAAAKTATSAAGVAIHGSTKRHRVEPIPSSVIELDGDD